MDRSKKKQAVAELHKDLQNALSVVVTHNNGLSVAEVTKLRLQMRDANARFRITKNTLAKIALKDTPYEHLIPHFSGPVGIAYSHEDVVAPAKVVVDFVKGNEKLSLVAGSMGEKEMSVADVKALASLPSLDSLRGKLIGVILAPATKIAGVTKAPAGKLARVISAYASKS